MQEISLKYKRSIRTIQRYFDKLEHPAINIEAPPDSVNLVVDATFFSRSDGVLVFRANARNLYWRYIQSETLVEIARGLDVLDEQGFEFKSVTLDGRRGVIKLFEARYPKIPVQMCQFHQAQIIRRYTTNNPKLPCGIELKAIMRCLTETDEDVFKSLIETLYEQYEDFIKEKNEHGQFKHRSLRSAFRSLRTNLPYLFAYRKFPELNIPNTTNSCDGSFAHWKQKVKIHRGLKRQRRNKMIDSLLKK